MRKKTIDFSKIRSLSESLAKNIQLGRDNPLLLQTFLLFRHTNILQSAQLLNLKNHLS